ncbi:(2,3-dihydroxybenzoyl)adenylate synthase [Streptomyces pseudovenezuelae]|uniref:2,3-dihydroxybenzoate-AMP ligase n=1 Tax=Streptomyces pseudovenezuelae TaxID=67350 RepID=A0ABT6M1V5_9ACTN|nr:AMP-binding protein [Streptomyces pseudovenezuelae]MDH6222507.1 2,3-dihydroxybenzoate-AMP ligase [Streptomyces pseudovenezuelae]
MDVVPWPEELVERYRRAGHWQGRPLGELLRERAREHPDAPALLSDGLSWSYAELDERGDRLAAGLVDLGVRPGDRVVVQLPNIPEILPLLIALFRLGALPVLGLPAYRASEAVHLCRSTDAVAYVVPDTDPDTGFDYRELAAEVRAKAPSLRHVLVAGEPGLYTPLREVDAAPRPLPAPAAGDPAVLLVSGGTTGLPKLIPRTHDDYFYNLRASAEVCGLHERSVYLAVLPIGHNFPLACPGVLGVLHAGGTVALCPSPSPETAFAAIERFRATVTAVVPPLAALWSQAVRWSAADIGSLELVQVGGARLSPDAARLIGPALGCELQQVFGMAEGLLSYTRRGDDAETVATTQGFPLSPDDEIRVVDAAGEDVPPGAVGNLLTRGPYTLRGYYRAPEHNLRAFTADGYYRTGDLVRLTAEGRLVVEGREKDLVNRGGDKISADELQNHLRAHPAVLDAAVVPVPDLYLGERTCACLLLRDGHDEAPDLTAFLHDRGLATYKIPDVVRIFDAFPLTSVGKVDKRELARAVTPKTDATASELRPGDPGAGTRSR